MEQALNDADKQATSELAADAALQDTDKAAENTETNPVDQETKDALPEAKWYVVHTYSGYENKVKATLTQVIQNRGLENLIQEVSVPTEEQVEIKDGKRHTYERKLYPGYVLLKMVMSDELWYIVRNTRGVTGFVGPDGDPIPLTAEELAIVGVETDWDPIVDYKVGDPIKVIHGPLEGFIGTVQEINHEKKKVIVVVSMFGRETPVELEFTQVLAV